jgi:hypothetical protein
MAVALSDTYPVGHGVESNCPVSVNRELSLVKRSFEHDKGTVWREAEESFDKHARFQGI